MKTSFKLFLLLVGFNIALFSCTAEAIDEASDETVMTDPPNRDLDHPDDDPD